MRYYYPKEKTLIAVLLALGLTEEQRWEMYYLVFPERAIYNEAMKNGYTVSRPTVCWNSRISPNLQTNDLYADIHDSTWGSASFLF